MPITKHAFPILEYDSDPTAVIAPTHEGLDIHLPERAVFAFLGDQIDLYAQHIGATKVAEFISATKHYPVYVMRHCGKDVCLCQAPVGASAATQLLDWLIGYGVRAIVSAGSCGVLVDLPENVFLIPCRALRDEGTSYHYLPPSRFMEIDARAREAIRLTLTEQGYASCEVTTWTTDGFYRETRDMVLYRKQEGCSVVEMECAALAACAQLRGAIWGEILFTADTLANTEEYDERTWGHASWGLALELCMDAVCYIKSRKE